MKNLELLELVHKPVQNIFSDVQIFAQASDSIYFIRNTLHKYDFTHNQTTELCPKQFEDATLVKHLTIENKICIVTSDSLHIFDPSGSNEIHTLTFDEQIAAISWNPTEEIVTIVSQTGAVATYSIDYENGEVFPQGQSSLGANIPDTVYVGWGSTETQFRGSEGKLKKQQTIPVEKPVEDEKPTISWRGNGEMFVVNYWVAQKRKFVVFETPCKALYKSEECPGLQPPVAWRPAGNMIASLSEVAGRQSIVIFEKNGQKRFNFGLNFGNVRVKGLKWSPCAQILTIHTEDSSTNSQNVHLLMASNYKWYEKQTLTFKANNPLLGFDWLETTQFTFTLRVVTRRDVVNYTFCSKICDSAALCAVIDGKTLQLTDFSEAVIPPIMCLKTITNNNPINFVCLNHSFIAIVDSENYLKFYHVDTLDLVKSVDLSEIDTQFPLAYHHFKSHGDDVYFAAETDSETVFYASSVKNKPNFLNVTGDTLRHLHTLSESLDVVGLKQIEGALYTNDDTCPNSIKQDVKIAGKITYNCHLSSNCHFYINANKISDCVNSFLIFGDYLLYTTKLNELYCLRFDLTLLGDSVQNYRRNIEQGATLVTAIPNSPKIVLQLPRGNLETISCRLISIDILDRLLNEQKWDEALRFIRLEKLNANLLFDLDPTRFLGQIGQFVEGAKTTHELNSVCLEFEEGNVLTTLYKNWGTCVEFKGKVEAVFGAILKYFDSGDYAAYITTIMVINLNFFTLRQALVYLQDLLRRSYDDVTLKQKLVDAINTLKTYGCDQDKLYREALLLYDLDLAHFVASCCQLDPRIYEPHLSNLKDLSEVERRYEINVFGKKPKIAVAYLLRCPEVTPDAVLSFIKRHSVCREAYESCAKSNRNFRTVSRAFADFLSGRYNHEEAGVVLRRGGLLEEALKEFKLSFNWKEVLDVVAELRLDEVERLRTVIELAEKLTQYNRFKEAASLYEFYANNYEMAVKILIEHYLFMDAVHIAKKHNRRDIIVSDVVPALTSHKTYLQENLTSLEETFNSYRTRLANVRQSKAAKFTSFSCEADDRDDLISDAGSTRSSRSSRSRSSKTSSKSKRKEERKKQRVREGGLYEDISLIGGLHSTINEIYTKADEVRTCCVLLLQESDTPYKEVRNFHDFYWKIVDNIRNNLKEIWPPHFCVGRQGQNAQELADLENFEHLYEGFRTAPNGPSCWKLGVF